MSRLNCRINAYQLVNNYSKNINAQKKAEGFLNKILFTEDLNDQSIHYYFTHEQFDRFVNESSINKATQLNWIGNLKNSFSLVFWQRESQEKRILVMLYTHVNLDYTEDKLNITSHLIESIDRLTSNDADSNNYKKTLKFKAKIIDDHMDYLLKVNDRVVSPKPYCNSKGTEEINTAENYLKCNNELNSKGLLHHYFTYYMYMQNKIQNIKSQNKFGIISSDYFEVINDTVKNGDCGLNAVHTALNVENKNVWHKRNSLNDIRYKMVILKNAYTTISNVLKNCSFYITEAQAKSLNSSLSTIFGDDINLFKNFVKRDISKKMSSLNNTPETINSLNIQENSLDLITGFNIDKSIWDLFIMQLENIASYQSQTKNLEKNKEWIESNDIIAYLLSQGYDFSNYKNYFIEDNEKNALLTFEHVISNKKIYIVNEGAELNNSKTISGQHFYCVLPLENQNPFNFDEPFTNNIELVQ